MISKKNLIVALIVFIVGCNNEEVSESRISDNLCVNQKLLSEKRNSYLKLYESSPNQAARNDVTDDFQLWLKKYFSKNLKSKIDSFIAEAVDVNTGRYQGQEFVYIRMKTYDNINFVELKEIGVFNKLKTDKTVQLAKGIILGEKYLLKAKYIDVSSFLEFVERESSVSTEDLQRAMSTMYGTIEEPFIKIHYTDLVKIN